MYMKLLFVCRVDQRTPELRTTSQYKYLKNKQSGKHYTSSVAYTKQMRLITTSLLINSFNISRIVATNTQLTAQYKTYKYNQSTNNTNVYEIVVRLQ
ncbi:unnamed protein product, partial [Schistosoma rodhaini]